MNFNDLPGEDCSDLHGGSDVKRDDHVLDAGQSGSDDTAGSQKNLHGAPLTDQRPVSLIGWGFAAIFGIACWIALAKLAGILG